MKPSPAKRGKPAVVVRETRVAEFDIPDYLRTSWTSNDNNKFTGILESLREAFPVGESDADGPTTYSLGFKQVFRMIESDCMSILCVVACVDHGKDAGITARLATACFLNGIPLVLGRGPRQLGAVFGKKRVSCLALTKFAASKPGLLDFIMNMSAISSQTRIPLEEAVDVNEKWMSVCARSKGQPADLKRKAAEIAGGAMRLSTNQSGSIQSPHTSTKPTFKHSGSNSSKPNSGNPTTPVGKQSQAKPKAAAAKKGGFKSPSFFSSFD